MLKMIMQTIVTFLKDFFKKSTSAKDITAAYKKRHTVRNALKIINLLIGFFMFALIWVPIYYYLDFDPSFSEWKASVLIIFSMGSILWLLGYRNAVAFSKTERQAYLKRTQEVIRRISRGFDKLIAIVFILLGVGLIVCLASIGFVVLLKQSNYLVDVFPALEPLTDSLIERVNEGLNLLTTYLR